MSDSSSTRRLSMLLIIGAIIGVAFSNKGFSILIDKMLFLPAFQKPTLPGSAVVVTGTSSGLGRHISLHLASKGFHVFSTVRNDNDASTLIGLWNAQSKKKIQLNDGAVSVVGGGAIVPIIMDVTSIKSVELASRQIKRYLLTQKTQDGNSISFTGIVNNAGVHADVGSIIDDTLSVEDFVWNFDVNVFGLVRVTKSLLSLLTSSKSGRGTGRIVNIGSPAGVLAIGGIAPYAGTKHALEGITDAWRNEFYKLEARISVSLVRPGFVESKMCPNTDLCGGGNSLQAVSDAVFDALYSERPKTRYNVGHVWILPTWLGILMSNILPDRIKDSVTQLTDWLANTNEYHQKK